MTFERLPYSIQPRLYQIDLVTNFETFVFDGTTVIQVDVLESTDCIKLNSAELRKAELISFITELKWPNSAFKYQCGESERNKSRLMGG